MTMEEKQRMLNRYKYGVDSNRPIMNESEAKVIRDQDEKNG